MNQKDPFTGTWKIWPERSKMGAPGVQSWVQWINATAEELRVQEEVVSGTGARANLSLEAKFDGKDYAVRGSSLADAMSYTRLERNKIAGTGKKNGGVTLRETIEVDRELMTLTYAILAGEREVTNGVAVFKRE
jgi:hypothetical protein